jgi:CRISPR-associated protein Cas1
LIARTIFIENDLNLSLHQGQMKASPRLAGGEIKFVPIEDLGVLVIENHHATLSNALIAALAENNVLVVHCANNKMPVAYTLPLQANTLYSQRLKQQITASMPLQKNIWQQLIKRKIKNQRLNMELHTIPCAKMKKWEDETLAGDSKNHEGRAAAFYWNHITGLPGFTRDALGVPPNNLLNYGYAILRAIAARGLVGSGLHPSLGVFHRNKYNPFCLADDVMEPYRPFVDQCVLQIMAAGLDYSELDKTIKKRLLQIPVMDVKIDGNKSPLSIAMSRTTASLQEVYAGKRKRLLLPEFTA